MSGSAPSRWAARAPRRPRGDCDVKLVPRVARLARGRRLAATRSSRSKREPWVDGVCARRRGRAAAPGRRLDRDHGRRPGGRRQRGGDALRPRARTALLGAVLGRERDQGAARRPSAQPRDRQRARRRARPGGRAGRAPQPDLRRRPQHGRGDGGRAAAAAGTTHSWPAGEREERPLRRRLLRGLRGGRRSRSADAASDRAPRGLADARAARCAATPRTSCSNASCAANARRWSCGTRRAPGSSPGSARRSRAWGSPSTGCSSSPTSSPRPPS